MAAKYPYTFINNLITITKNGSHIVFLFEDEEEVPDNPTGDVFKRSEILAIINSDELKLHEFVDLIGDDPNTGFNTFVSKYIIT